MNGSAGSQHDSITTTGSAVAQPTSPSGTVFAGLADSYEENSAPNLFLGNDGNTVPLHHAALLRFLQSQGGGNVLSGDDASRSSKARDKLTRLSRSQFSELSTDVYDELLRRGSPTASASSPFLIPRDHYHPKRNQARQKLASLPSSRFKDLVADVFFELQRRFPHVIQTQRPMEPEKRSFQSNTIIPNKSTMVEDDSGAYDDPSRPQTARSHTSVTSSNHQSHQSIHTTSPPPPMSSRSDLSSIRESPGYRGAISGDSSTFGEAPREGDQVVKLRNRIRALEDQVAVANVKLASYQEENQKLKDAKEDSEKEPRLPEIEKELDQARSQIRSLQLEIQNSKLATPDSNLQIENDRLKGELERQRRITEDVRQETTDLLDEVRKLAESEGSSWEEKERLQRGNEELKVEITQWKARAMKTQLRNLRATSTFLTQSLSLSLVPEDAPFISETGQIDDIYVTKFQMAIDEILIAARSPNPSSVLDRMKGIVLSIRGLTKNLDEMPPETSDFERIQKLRTRISATANNLMTAAKNHATANGLSPVSLLDAAASHLTSTVVELVKVVKVRPTFQKVSPDDDDEEGPSPNGPNISTPPQTSRAAVSFRGSGQRQRTSSTPRSCNGTETEVTMSPSSRTSTRLKSSMSDLVDLKTFLEVQTSSIVESIQKLLSQIRSETDIGLLLRHIAEIVQIVTAVVTQSQKTMLTVPTFNISGQPVVQKLSDCAQRLSDMKSTVDENGPQSADKAYKQKLAGVAFDTAKQTKELVRLVESLDSPNV